MAQHITPLNCIDNSQVQILNKVPKVVLFSWVLQYTRFLKSISIYAYINIRTNIRIWHKNDTFYHQRLFEIHCERNSRIIRASAKFAAKYHEVARKCNYQQWPAVLILIFVFLSTFFLAYQLLTDCFSFSSCNASTR